VQTFYGIDPSLLILFLSGPPEMESDYLDRYVAQVGDTVKLHCPIIGTPKPIIEWYQVSTKLLVPKHSVQ
jgi:Immunoglobulin I-set domain